MLWSLSLVRFSYQGVVQLGLKINSSIEFIIFSSHLDEIPMLAMEDVDTPASEFRFLVYVVMQLQSQQCYCSWCWFFNVAALSPKAGTSQHSKWLITSFNDLLSQQISCSKNHPNLGHSSVFFYMDHIFFNISYIFFRSFPTQNRRFVFISHRFLPTPPIGFRPAVAVKSPSAAMARQPLEDWEKASGAHLANPLGSWKTGRETHPDGQLWWLATSDCDLMFPKPNSEVTRQQQILMLLKRQKTSMHIYA